MHSKIMNILREKMNSLSAAGEPFLVIIDFEQDRPLLYKLDDLPPDILFETTLGGRDKITDVSIKNRKLVSFPIDYHTYLAAFENVKANIAHGNTYLLNLTFPTPLDTDLKLQDIYSASGAKYKLLVKNDFVVFSPETFISIRDRYIRSYPMKGTIDASVENALESILKDEKELSEHNTIVDLIRNDLSIVANDVEVTKYRYHDIIKAGDRELIQISSEITGTLKENWKQQLGDIILSMLPAGSISGAPKHETLRIIKECETGERGYYTGIFGYFDGECFDSAVMIRFIEQKNGKYVYRSGGGITWLSDPRKEYEELIAKVYVPFV